MSLRRIDVAVEAAPYAVHVGPGALDHASSLIPVPRGAETIALISDATVMALHGPAARDGLGRLGLRIEEMAIPPGEPSKSAGTLAAVWEWLADVRLHRADIVVALGGGVVGDVAGFAAATYHRGIPVVQVPTTLLAQVDAAIGGKTAIDLPAGKNLVGSFHQPIAVIADTTLLETLPEAERATGMAEIIKHGLIADPGLLERVSAWRWPTDVRDLAALVADAAAVKAGIVAEDVTERGRRAHLNYGHTLGHALESLGAYESLTHGQAVAIGMMFAANLAALLGHADHVALHREIIEIHGLPTGGAGASFDAVSEAWSRDKKYDKGVRFVLLEDIARPTVVGGIPEDVIRQAYEEVR